MNRLRNIFFPQPMWETPDPSGAGGAGNPAPGTAPVGQGQPPASGDPNNQGIWSMFPDVPEDQRSLLEPHIRGAQGRITELEQQYAPFKPFLDRGFSPEAAEGLLRFSADFEARPLDMWLAMGQRLQQAQNGRPPVLDPELDMEHLAALARGEDPDAQTGPGYDPSQVPGEGQLPPEILQYIQQQQARIDQLEQGLTQDRVARQESVQNRLLNEQLGTMKKALTDAGWPEDLITDEELYSRLIVSGGNIQAAITSMVNVQSGLLKNYTTNHQQGQPGDLNMPNGAPPTPPQEKPSGRGSDSWGKARTQATQRLRQSNVAAAQQQ